MIAGGINEGDRISSFVIADAWRWSVFRSKRCKLAVELTFAPDEAIGTAQIMWISRLPVCAARDVVYWHFIEVPSGRTQVR